MERPAVPETTRTPDGPILLAILWELAAIRALLETQISGAGVAQAAPPPVPKSRGSTRKEKAK
ncbi:MAG: hypothetical protein WC718_14465 [Phycisphaerales bacterium]